MIFIELFLLSIVSGVLGRMGGSSQFNTKWRDIGCSLCVILAWIIVFGFNISYWWVYLIVFGLHWAAFTTYWDWLFKFDNFGFSGFVVGLAALPFLFISPWLWAFLVARCFLLGTAWFLLNKYMPSKFIVWNRDIAEEFFRYKSVVF